MPIGQIHRRIFGRTNLFMTLLDGITGTTDGEWVQIAGFMPMTVEVTGISTATIIVCGSCALVKPADNTHGIALGTLVADGGLALDNTVEWLKARCSAYTAGTITVRAMGAQID